MAEERLNGSYAVDGSIRVEPLVAAELAVWALDDDHDVLDSVG